MTPRKNHFTKRQLEKIIALKMFTSDHWYKMYLKVSEQAEKHWKSLLEAHDKIIKMVEKEHDRIWNEAKKHLGDKEND